MTPTLWSAIATLGPIGRLRPAPGTWGSLFGVITGYGLASVSPRLLEIGIVIVIIIGTIAASKHQESTGRKDASEVIIDEVAGQWIALLVIPLDWRWALAAFLLFRLFDITKPGPIGMVEKWPRGIGVMADDIIAGIAAALCLWIAQLVLMPSLL